MRRLAVLALAALAALLTGTSVARSQKRPPLMLAVLRQDGVLIPFATASQTSWTNSWPQPRQRFDVPITLADVPKEWWPEQRPQTEWTLWLRDGTSRPLRVVAPVWFRAQCLANVGLRTDFRSLAPLPPPDATPFPKEGLATSAAPGSGPVVEPVAVLDESSQDWRSMRDVLTKPLQVAEDKAFREVRGVLSHPPDPTTRMNTPIVIEALYRSPDARPGDFVYYFEAVRRYRNPEPPRPGEPPCDLLTYAWGWIRMRAHRSEATVFAQISDCYRWNVSFVLPLGVMRAPDGHPVWIIQSSSWQGESYYILELDTAVKPRVLWLTPGGWCS